MSDNPQKRFDVLLKAMVQGAAPERREKAEKDRPKSHPLIPSCDS